MSFDTSQVTGLNGDAKQIIFALKSKLGRREEEIERLNERVLVLQNLVRSTSDDRDEYMNRCDELEQLLATKEATA
jgi:hypothetical protein